MCQQQVVRHSENLPEAARSRCFQPKHMANPGNNCRLVQRTPEWHIRAKLTEAGGSELGEPERRRTIRPAALVLQRLRQIPVVERGHWHDPARAHPGDQLPIECDSLLIDWPAAGWKQPWPRDREAVAADAKLRDGIQIFFPAVIMVTRQVASVTTTYPAERVGETIPDAFALTVLVPGPLDLIGRRRHAPQKVWRKAQCFQSVHFHAASTARNLRASAAVYRNWLRRVK